MNGPHRAGFYEAMVAELKTLTDMICWDVVDRDSGINVLPSTWAFKLKRYPDGSVRKYKPGFCAGGHRQIERVDFYEKFAPVVKWMTARTSYSITDFESFYQAIGLYSGVHTCADS
jgi:hypothetical protein